MHSIKFALPLKKPSRYELPAILEKFAELFGYVALEITVTSASLDGVKRFIKKLDPYSLHVPVYLRFHTSVKSEYDPFKVFASDLHDRYYIDTLVNFISENFGGGYLVLHSNFEPQEKEIQNVSEFVRKSRQKGVIICLENLAQGWSADPYRLSEVLLKTGLKGVLDVGHLNSSTLLRTGALTRLEALDLLAPYLVGAHIYEYEHNGHVAPEDGFLLFDVLDALYRLGVDWWVIELENENDIEKTLKVVSQITQ